MQGLTQEKQPTTGRIAPKILAYKLQHSLLSI
jgi:hypothetical protein